jgi:hypothetical protein
MKLLFFIVTMFFLTSQTGLGQLEIKETNGGSITTQLGMGIAVNSESSLSRRWFVVNDVSSPARLDGAGIRTLYVDRGYKFQAGGLLISDNATLAAVEVRFMLFDVWGDHMKTLSYDEVKDIKPSLVLDLSKGGNWHAGENDVSQYLTCVAFIARVRRSDGGGWGMDSQTIKSKVEELKLKLSNEALSPSKETK